MVLVARNGAKYLPRTLAAIAAQVRRPDDVLFIDVSSSDTSGDILVSAAPGHVFTTPGRRSFGAAVAHALQVSPPQASDDEWLWLLGHDNAPDPRALAALLGAVEVAPSVAVAGPKLMRWDDGSVIAGFGETLTRFGRSIAIVTDELDQAQFDVQSDLLGVAAGGMLVRRQVWGALGGFDPALPSADAALDFSIRVRLAGHRVVGVPTAKVASAGTPELFGRRSVSAGSLNRIRRSAQLHRRFVYAPPLAIPVHWLSVVPLAIVRSVVHLVSKRPGLVGGELAAGVAGAFDGGVPGARTRIRQNRALGWASVAPLRMPWSDVREQRAHDRTTSSGPAPERVGPGFFVGGGAWMVLLAAIAGAIAFGRFVNASALTGGGLVPLSATVSELWSHVGYGWRDVGAGFVGAADPFTYVLAVLGSLTFWSPSFSVVLFYLLAIPLSALTAWWCAARLSERSWAPAFAALAWAASAPLLASLGGGHLGSVIAHVLLPVLILAIVNAARSWAGTAVAAIVFAAVTAAAPILTPALLVAWLLWMLVRPKSIHRLIGIPIPAAALFAPLVVQQLSRGNWLALVAEPGVPVVSVPGSSWQFSIGSTDSGLAGWDAFVVALGLSPALAPVIVAILIAPLALLALLALFLPSSHRAIPALLLALLGFGTAVAGSHIQVTVIGSATTSVWPGAALSLYWLGLVGAASVAIEVFGRRAGAPAIIASVAVLLLAVPLFAASATGAIAVSASKPRLLPAFVSAEAVSRPMLGTLQLDAQPNGAMSVGVQRGLGTTLDEQSTLDATDVSMSAGDLRLATLAGNLASRSGFDVARELDALQLGFVLVPHTANPAAATTHDRLADALNGNRVLSPVGDTASGYLWHYENLAAGEAPTGPSATATMTGIAILVGQGLVFLVVLLLAIPSRRRRRMRAAVATDSDDAGVQS